MKVDMNLLKQLRDITFAPMKDCKDCLEEANWDLDLAQELLKKKWLTKAAKKSDRETKEWIVKVKTFNDMTVGIKLACETDFVAKNEMFIELADKVLETVATYAKQVDSLVEIDESFINDKVNPLIQDWIARISENIRLIDLFITNKKSYIYLHPGDKLSAIIFYEWDSTDTAKEIALQVAAMNPEYLDRDSVPAETIQKIKDDFMEEMKSSWKPADILEKIVEWKINKSLSDFVLTEQLYIRDETKKIKDILPAGFKLIGFKRFSI